MTGITELSAQTSADDTVVTYPDEIYPLSANQVLRHSEILFTEDNNTKQFGFDTPFPKVSRQQFNIEDFGAVADGTTDCTAAFYKVIATAKACNQPAEIVFMSKGRYYFHPQPTLGSDEYSILNVQAAENLVIRGQGFETVLVFGDPSLGGLAITGGHTVMLQDFAMDYNMLPFTQGTVSELNTETGAFTFTLHDGYPTPAQISAAVPGNHAGYKIAQANGGAQKWPVIGALFITGMEEQEPGKWLFHADPAALGAALNENDEFIFVGRRIAQMALNFTRTKGAYLKDVAVHASPTCGMCLRDVDGANIDGYVDAIPAGSTRLLASNADGIFVHGLRGGITVKNCYFMGQGDDCINLHCPAFSSRYVKQISDHELIIMSDTDIHTGDTLEIMEPTAAIIKGQVTVASATPAEDGKSVQLVLDEALSDIGYVLETDYVYPASLCASNFKIISNYFGQNRSRCLLIVSRDGLIAANTIENAEGYGVRFEYGGTTWAEGVIAKRVTIQDNLFRNVTGVGLAPVIELGDGSKNRNYADIKVQGNRFINTRKMIVMAVGCDGIEIIDNAVETEPGQRMTWNHPQWYPIDCSIYLDNCKGALVDGLSLRDPNLTECVVYVGKDCEAGEEGVVLRNIKTEILTTIPVVRDDRL